MDHRYVRLSTNAGVVHQTHLVLLRSMLWSGMSTQGCGFFAQRTSFPRSGSRGSVSLVFCDPEEVMLRAGEHGRSVRPWCPQVCKCDTEVKNHYQHLSNASSTSTFLVFKT